MASRDRFKASGKIDPGYVRWTYWPPNGYVDFPGQLTDPATQVRTLDTNDSPGVDHHFLTQGFSVDSTPISGKVGQYEYNACSPGYGGDFLSPPTPSSDDSSVIKALSRTNPSRPVADIGVSIAELRDAPQLIKIAGDTLLKRGANAYLSYQFGWKPLISDVKALLNFQSHVEKRRAELMRLYSGRGLKRRVRLGSHFGQKTFGNYPIMTFGPYLTSNGRSTVHQRRWATVRYSPRYGSIPPKSDKEYTKLATRAVYGLTIDQSTAWELMPWSWMIDWFSNMGDFLVATRNIVGADVTSCCVMTHTEQVITIEDTTYPGLSGGGSTQRRWTKQRYVAPPLYLPELDLGPIISPYRASILGSLAVSKIPSSKLRL